MLLRKGIFVAVPFFGERVLLQSIVEEACGMSLMSAMQQGIVSECSLRSCGIFMTAFFVFASCVSAPVTDWATSPSAYRAVYPDSGYIAQPRRGATREAVELAAGGTLDIRNTSGKRVGYIDGNNIRDASGKRVGYIDGSASRVQSGAAGLLLLL